MENYWQNHATDEAWAKIPTELRLRGMPVEEIVKNVSVLEIMEKVPI